MPIKIANMTKAEVEALIPKDSTICTYAEVITETEAQIGINKEFVTSATFKPGLAGNLMEMTWILQDESFIKIIASYNKNMRTKLSSGYVNNGTFYVMNNSTASCRNINDYSDNLVEIFRHLQSDLSRGKVMKYGLQQTSLTEERVAEIVGIAFIYTGLLTVTQVANVARRIDEHTPVNLDEMYQAISSTFSDSHATMVIDDYITLRELVKNLEDRARAAELSSNVGSLRATVSTTGVSVELLSKSIYSEEYVSPIPSVIFL